MIVAQFPSGGEYLREKLQNSVGGQIFQLVFYFIVMVILLNMLFGIIVYVLRVCARRRAPHRSRAPACRDTFAQLRAEREEQEKVMRSRCFVCDLEAHKLDRLGDGFDRHTQREHYMWDFLHYYCYVRERVRQVSHMPPGGRQYVPLTGVERYVLRQYAAEDPAERVQFYPQQQARCIQKRQGAAREQEAERRNYARELNDLKVKMLEMMRDLRSTKDSIKKSEELLSDIQAMASQFAQEDDDAGAA